MNTRTLALVVLLSIRAAGSASADPPPTVEGKDASAWAALFEDEREAVKARDRLGASGKAGVPIAADLLASPSPVVRGWATWVVVLLGADGVALRPTVARLLSDRDASVREEAVGAVGAMRETFGAEVLEPVREILREDGWSAQGRAADVLRNLGAKAVAAVPDLVAVLENGKVHVADNFARALLSMGDPGTEALVRAFPRLDGEHREHASEGVAEAADVAGSRLVALLASADGDLAAGSEAVCTAAGWRILPALLEAVRLGRPAESYIRAFRVRDAILTRGIRAYLAPGQDDVLVVGTPLAIDPTGVEIRWEGGSGHGGSAFLWRTRRTADGLFVRSLAFTGPSVGRPDARPTVVVEELGPIPAARTTAVYEVLSRVLAMRLEERPRDPGEHRSIRSSSADFHARARIASQGRAVFDETFTGYYGSRSHRDSCRVEAATRVLSEWVSDMPVTTRAPDDEDLGDLLARCATIAKDKWWVKSRLLRIVEGAGDARFEPMLRAYIETAPDPNPWDHIAAIDAYARITGVDLREGPLERETLPAARERYLARFRSAGGTAAPK